MGETELITWQKVIAASEISGTPQGQSSTYTAEDYFDGEFGFESATNNWWGGTIAKSYTPENTDFLYKFSESAQTTAPDEVDVTEYYRSALTFVYSNGTSSTAGSSFAVLLPFENDSSEISQGSFSSTATNSTWSQSAVTLSSYETLTSAYTAKVTTVSAITVSVPTSTLDASVTTTTLSGVPATTTSTTNGSITRSTSRVSSYATTFVTGQTTAVAYSSFSHTLPLVLSGTNATTATALLEPLSFVALTGTNSQTNSAGNPQSSQTGTTNLPTLATTQGSRISFNTLSGPLVTSGTSKLATINSASAAYTTAAPSFSFLANHSSTYSTTQIERTTLTFAESQVVVSHSKATTSASSNSRYYVSTAIYNSTKTLSTSGGVEIENKAAFATAYFGTVSAANKITVGVSAKSGLAAGASVNSAGSANNFSQADSSAVLAVTKKVLGTTFSANSFTTRSGSQSGTGVFSVAGNSVSQWNIAAAISATAPVTVFGGKIAGQALVLPGIYETYAGTDSSTTAVTAAQTLSWSSDASITGYRSHTFSVNTLTPVKAVHTFLRHPTTQILDDL